MSLSDFVKDCWNYYLILESDFTDISRYIAFEEHNKDSYSIEFSKQIQSICSEIDVVCKLYCELLDPTKKCGNIKDYANIILLENQIITNAEVKCDGFNIQPWKDWKCDHNDYGNGNNPLNVSPSWWNSYNNIKHYRLNICKSTGLHNYKKSNLLNTITSLAALYILEMNMYKELAEKSNNNITKPSNESRFFRYVDWETHITPLGNGAVLTSIQV